MHIMQIANFVVSSVKGSYVCRESEYKEGYATQHGNRLNGMEPKAFYQLNYLQHSGTGLAV